MGFDVAKFERAQFARRMQSVPVPALAPFFADGEATEWTVQGLTSTELHRALEAGKRQGQVESIVRAITTSGDAAQAVRKAIGLSDDTPGEIAKRLEMLVLGSVAPKVDLPAAVKLAGTFPIEFLTLTNTISELTGQGFDLPKVEAASQPTTASISP